MAIIKEIVEDKIEIVGEYRNIQIRTATVIKEDDEELTRSFNRKVLECVTSSYDSDTEEWIHSDTDISEESIEVQAICNAVWTTEVKNAKKAHNESLGLK
tara:strand:+ start:52 stop:351 length:300 start_codon:yes stop_codon:yes gene_type:complete